MWTVQWRAAVPSARLWPAYRYGWSKVGRPGGTRAGGAEQISPGERSQRPDDRLAQPGRFGGCAVTPDPFTERPGSRPRRSTSSTSAGHRSGMQRSSQGRSRQRCWARRTTFAPNVTVFENRGRRRLCFKYRPAVWPFRSDRIVKQPQQIKKMLEEMLRAMKFMRENRATRSQLLFENWGWTRQRRQRATNRSSVS